ncbi:unnamed protein product [Linum trigynum]|uniref:RING-type domain-containing protein n=2 Tax=Linum trigynum TaxID=586398 RepID=A0AAV2DTQ5_9ROSI
MLFLLLLVCLLFANENMISRLTSHAMASRRMNQGQEVWFPTSAPDLNEEIESIDLNHSASLTGRARNTLSLFPDVPDAYALSMPQNHVEGAPKSEFSMPPCSQTDVKPMTLPQNYLHEGSLPATSTAGIPFFEENVNRYNRYPYLENAMIPEDKMMAFPQINDPEKSRIGWSTMAGTHFTDRGSLVHDVSGGSTIDTKTRPGIRANESVQAEMHSENVPTLGLGAGSYMENRPRDAISSVGSTGAIVTDRRAFSLYDMGFSNFGNDLDIFTRSQPNVGGVAFQSGLSTHHNEVPRRAQNIDNQRLLQNFSAFPQPAENAMLQIENFRGFPNNLQNMGFSSRIPQNSDADTLAPFVFEPHAYQIPSNWDLELQGNRAAPASEDSYATDGFWGSLAELPGLHNSNQVSFPGDYEQSGLARFPSSNSNPSMHRGMQSDSYQTKNPYLGSHNDFSPGSYFNSPSMGVTRSINNSQELTGDFGLPQAIAPVQPSRGPPTTTYRAGISSTPPNLVSNVPPAAASGSVSVGPSRKRSMLESRSDTAQAARRKRSISNLVQSSPSSATASVTSPGWNAPFGTSYNLGTPLYPPQTSTAAALHRAQVPTAGFHPPQVSTVAVHPPQASRKALPQSRVPAVPSHQAPTVVRRSPQAPTVAHRQLQAPTVAHRPPQAPRVDVPQSQASSVPLHPPARAPTVANRPPRGPTVSRTLPSTRSMEHIRWQGPEGDPAPSEFKCLLCKRDLPFSPEGAMTVPRNPPPVSVLPCHHQFHTYCLELITPREQASNPPCLPCAMGDTIK